MIHDNWPTGLFARTLIDEQSTAAWLNMCWVVEREGKEQVMRIRIQVIIEADQEATPACVEEVACFERGPLSPETLGLRLDEAKQMLVGVQQVMATQQVEEYVEQQHRCSHCQQPLTCKGRHQI